MLGMISQAFNIYDVIYNILTRKNKLCSKWDLPNEGEIYIGEMTKYTFLNPHYSKTIWVYIGSGYTIWRLTTVKIGNRKDLSSDYVDSTKKIMTARTGQGPCCIMLDPESPG